MDEFISKTIVFNGLNDLNYDVTKKYLSNNEIQFDITDTIKTKLYHQRRVTADGQILFLVNSSISTSVAGNFYIAGKAAKVMNTMTGEIKPYACIKSGNGISIDYNLSEAGSLLLFISNNAAEMLARKTPPKFVQGTIVAPAGELTISRLRP